jgi:hypothetical protein
LIPTTDHNEALAGDTLYSAFLNHEWRTIVLPFVIAGMKQLAAAIEDESERQDFEVLYGAMIDDFYNADSPGGTMTPMAVHVARDASLAIAAATPTFITWDTLVYQYTDVIWASGNPTEFIIPTDGAGWWLISGTLQLSGTTVVQNRFVEILVNGSGKYMTWENGNNQSGNQLSHAQYLDDGDIVKIRITCAGAVTLLGTTEYMTVRHE